MAWLVLVVSGVFEAVWATEEDLVKFGLIKPRRRGIRAWMPTLGRG